MSLPPPVTQEHALACADRIGDACRPEDARDVVDRVRQKLAVLRTNVESLWSITPMGEAGERWDECLQESNEAVAEIDAIMGLLYRCQNPPAPGVEGS